MNWEFTIQIKYPLILMDIEISAILSVFLCVASFSCDFSFLP